MPEDHFAQTKNQTSDTFLGFNQSQRKAVLRWMAYLGMLGLGFLTIIGVIYYLQLGSWQLLAIALTSLLSAVVIGVSLNLTSRNQIQWGGITLATGIMIIVLGLTAFLSNYSLNILAGGLLLLLAMSLFVFPPRAWISIPFTIALIGIYYVINFIAMPVRYDPNQAAILRDYLIAFGPVVAGAILIRILYIYLQILTSIRSRLIFSSVVVVVLAVLTTNVVSSLIGFQNSQRQMTNQLESIATLKEQEIDIWVQNLQNNINTILTGDEATRRVRTLLSTPEDTTSNSDTKASQAEMLGRFQQVIHNTNLYDDIFLVDKTGRVVVTTNDSASNLAHIQSDWKHIKKGLQGAYVSPFYVTVFSSFDIRPTVIIAIPVIGRQGESLGLLAGRANLTVLSNIMLEHAGLGQTGETYLIGNDHTLLTSSRFPEWQNLLHQVVNTNGVRAALKQTDGSSQYLGYRGQPVMGVYHWFPTLQVALIAEQEQSEGLRSVNTNILINIIIAIFVVTLAILASLYISNSIARPLSKLSKTAAAVTGGDLEQHAEVERNDEVGTLAVAFNTMTDQMHTLIDSLETRVLDRTRALEKRAAQIETVSDIANDIASIDDLNELLDHAVEVVRDRFNFYHAGIFLADDRDEFAVLRAATGEAGKEMLERHHKLRIGEVGIVGYAVGKGEPRVTSNVSEDAVHYVNPLLPETCSEMALPLRVGNRVIGALDVQSREINAFQPEDIRILQIMADQLAVAISKANLVQELQSNLAELQVITRQYSRQEWEDFLTSSQKKLGFRLTHSGIKANGHQNPEVRQVLATKQTVILPGSEKTPTSSLAVPITLRGQVIGVVNLKIDGQMVPKDMVELVEGASARLAMALENARLVEQIQSKAEREHLIGEITSRVRATTDVDQILQTAVRELGRVLGASEVLIQLQTRDEQEEGA